MFEVVYKGRTFVLHTAKAASLVKRAQGAHLDGCEDVAKGLISQAIALEKPFNS